MLTPRENYLLAVHHETPERVPIMGVDSYVTGFGAGFGPSFEKGTPNHPVDGFGVRWIFPASGSGAAIPAPGEFILDAENIVDWKKLVTFPNVNDFDWETEAKNDFSKFDRTERLVEFGSGNGPFERIAALMGFEEALLAMQLEPEAFYELIDAIVDYKIEVVEKVAQYYKPDLYTSYEDIATERNLFMSPDSYRALIKPQTKRYYDAVKAFDMIPMQHTCGRCEDIIPDLIEIGTNGWSSAQPSNDIAGLLQKHGHRFNIVGGFDSTGHPGSDKATEEEIAAEVRRCFDSYGPYQGYIFYGFRLVNSLVLEGRAVEMAKVLEPAMEFSKAMAKSGA